MSFGSVSIRIGILTIKYNWITGFVCILFFFYFDVSSGLCAFNVNPIYLAVYSVILHIHSHDRFVSAVCVFVCSKWVSRTKCSWVHIHSSHRPIWYMIYTETTRTHTNASKLELSPMHICNSSFQNVSTKCAERYRTSLRNEDLFSSFWIPEIENLIVLNFGIDNIRRMLY